MFFLLISCYFKEFFKIPLESQNARLKLTLAIRTGATITVVNYAIEMLPVVTDKTINGLSK